LTQYIEKTLVQINDENFLAICIKIGLVLVIFLHLQEFFCITMAVNVPKMTCLWIYA